MGSSYSLIPSAEANIAISNFVGVARNDLTVEDMVSLMVDEGLSEEAKSKWPAFIKVALASERADHFKTNMKF